MTTELGPPGAKMSTVSRAGFGGRGPSKLVAGGIWSQSKFFFSEIIEQRLKKESSIFEIK